MRVGAGPCVGLGVIAGVLVGVGVTFGLSGEAGLEVSLGVGETAGLRVAVGDGGTGVSVSDRFGDCIESSLFLAMGEYSTLLVSRAALPFTVSSFLA